eukprot:CAMPEP_0206548586 /NCGR_PEP_ID=MMETSP0325_2-20121206/13969_1 /ASSEMBLY_ACC=CAM_ASM_000347 /TAXON_ID=2866 /ORGANISM="Crypthecodinium cohnii, Strain Seligo" /LENGTH=861 /DNA_ID=CAMNT_0054048089 /DNA_START=1 /DNA_END=2586 /DNA_ORIENTATION=-
MATTGDWSRPIGRDGWHYQTIDDLGGREEPEVLARRYRNDSSEAPPSQLMGPGAASHPSQLPVLGDSSPSREPLMKRTCILDCGEVAPEARRGIEDEEEHMGVSESHPRYRCLSATQIVGSLLLACVLVCIAVIWEPWKIGGLRFRSRSRSDLSQKFPCSEEQAGVKFLTEAALYQLSPISSAQECRSHCDREPRCGAWSYGKVDAGEGFEKVCFLTGLSDEEKPDSKPDERFVSGLSCKATANAQGVSNYPEIKGEARWANDLSLPCGKAHDGVDFWTTAPLYKVSPLPSAEACAVRCQEVEDCKVWTWGKPGGGISMDAACFLKDVGSDGQAKRHDNPGVQSGLACKDTDAAAPNTQNWSLVPQREISSERCRSYMENTAFGADQEDTVRLTHVLGPDLCSRYCHGSETCHAWTWSTSSSDHEVTESEASGQLGTCQLLATEKVTRAKSRGSFASLDSCEGDQALPKQTETISAAEVSDTKSHEDLSDGVEKHSESKDDRSCVDNEEDRDFHTKERLYEIPNCPNADECLFHCNHDERCGAWSFGELSGVPGLSNVCFIKGLKSDEEVDRQVKAGIISGFPCRSLTSTVTTTTLATTTTVATTKAKVTDITFPDSFPPGSLYCYALMQPEGYEKGLLRMQYQEGQSIFACDEYTVYSNQVIELSEKLHTHVVNVDLHCKYGGEFKTALNNDIFFAVWDKVVEEGRFRLHTWTVKVDPDCVFFPTRLRKILVDHPIEDNAKGLYLNNCRRGLHGPLEIFSRQAIEVWHTGRKGCVDYFWKLCSGDCLWGEDMFIDQCMQRYLKVPRDDDWDLLVEAHCDPPDGWDKCEDSTKVAFHPFKSQEAYAECMASSQDLAADWEK